MKKLKKETSFEPAALAAASPQVLPAREADAILPADAPVLQRSAALRKRLQSDVKALDIRTPEKGGPVRRKLKNRGGEWVEPQTIQIGDRTNFPARTWNALAAVNTDANSADINPSLKAKLREEADLLNSYWGYVGIREPEYDLLEPWTLLDVESLYKQSIERRLSLAFRNGYEVTGDNSSFVDYINRRLAQMSFIMRQEFESFFKEVLLNLYVCSNCIIIKIRDEEGSGGVPNEKNNNRTPIAAYKIIPPQTIFPYLDGKGSIEKWRRFFGNGRPYRDYDVEDVIHFHWDKKPGHLFGTPRTASVRDDIFALRRHEENYELLLVNHLFPLFHVAVGSEEAPCEILPNGLSEIDVIKRLIQEMPKEGVFVTDERVKVDVHGAAKEGIDPNPLLEHYKQRVISGLGMSPMDLGIADTSNRATADSISQNLKDSIITDLKWFGGQVKMFVFRDLFSESRTALSVQRATDDISIEFHEIDMDTMVKKETHAINKFNNQAITRTELRQHLKMKPVEKHQEKDTNNELIAMNAKRFDAKQQKDMSALSHEQALELQKADQKHQAKLASESTASNERVQVHKASSTKTTKVSRKFANGGGHTKETTEPTKHAAKAVASLLQPSNQHGKNLDPHKARSSQDPDLAGRVFDALVTIHQDYREHWGSAAAAWIDSAFSADGMGRVRAQLKRLVPTEFDSDLLRISIDTWAADPFGEDLDEEDLPNYDPAEDEKDEGKLAA
jgi:hypothetical protein